MFSSFLITSYYQKKKEEKLQSEEESEGEAHGVGYMKRSQVWCM